VGVTLIVMNTLGSVLSISSAAIDDKQHLRSDLVVRQAGAASSGDKDPRRMLRRTFEAFARHVPRRLRSGIVLIDSAKHGLLGAQLTDRLVDLLCNELDGAPPQLAAFFILPASFQCLPLIG
jgi:hypothetical protein